MKYIMFDTSVSLPLFVVFGENVSHDRVAAALEGKDLGTPAHPVVVGKLTSAGFMDVKEPHVHGQSHTLHLAATKDTDEWAKVLVK